MAISGERDQKKRAVLVGSEAGDIHQWQCSIEGCAQNYSPDLGYFTVARNDDHWAGSGSASLRIRRSATQVICGEHEDFMFLESFDVNTNLELPLSSEERSANNEDTGRRPSRLLAG